MLKYLKINKISDHFTHNKIKQKSHIDINITYTNKAKY